LIAVVAALFPLIATAQATPTGSPMPTRGVFVAGDAFDLIPSGEPDTVSVVTMSAQNIPEYGLLAVVIRNNSDAMVGILQVTAAAKTADGGLFEVSYLSSIRPAFVPPGELAIGTVHFRVTTHRSGKDVRLRRRVAWSSGRKQRISTVSHPTACNN
jgi:hypothetical protein